MTKTFKRRTVYTVLAIITIALALGVFGFATYEFFDSPDRPAPVYYEPDTE